jgi:hypothetical protein
MNLAYQIFIFHLPHYRPSPRCRAVLSKYLAQDVYGTYLMYLTLMKLSILLTSMCDEKMDEVEVCVSLYRVSSGFPSGTSDYNPRFLCFHDEISDIFILFVVF